MSPYIKQERRAIFNPIICAISDHNVEVGDLNYIVTRLLLETNPKCYADYNALIGMLECCKLEMYARRVRPYEDEKCGQHGEVY